MKLTTKGRYAVTAMMDLALQNSATEYVVLSDIAMRQNISLSYLEQLFIPLKKADLVLSLRGPSGGYRLARASEDISLADILQAVGEAMDFSCGNDCNENLPCLTHYLWNKVNATLFSFLQQQKLSDMVCDDNVKNIYAKQIPEKITASVDINFSYKKT